MVTWVEEEDSTGKTRCALLVKAGPIGELLNLPSKTTPPRFLISAVTGASPKWEKAFRAWAPRGCRELRASIETMSRAEACQATLARQASPTRTPVVVEPVVVEADSEVMTR